MIEINEKPDKEILAFKVSGKLTQEELDDLMPSLEKHALSSDDPHLLMIMEDFEGWKVADAFWKDLQLDAKYNGYFDRIAIVGDKKWQKLGTQLVDHIKKEELKYFPIDCAEEAWNWTEQKNH